MIPSRNQHPSSGTPSTSYSCKISEFLVNHHRDINRRTSNQRRELFDLKVKPLTLRQDNIDGRVTGFNDGERERATARFRLLCLELSRKIYWWNRTKYRALNPTLSLNLTLNLRVTICVIVITKKLVHSLRVGFSRTERRYTSMWKRYISSRRYTFYLHKATIRRKSSSAADSSHPNGLLFRWCDSDPSHSITTNHRKQVYWRFRLTGVVHSEHVKI